MLWGKKLDICFANKEILTQRGFAKYIQKKLNTEWSDFLSIKDAWQSLLI